MCNKRLYEQNRIFVGIALLSFVPAFPPGVEVGIWNLHGYFMEKERESIIAESAHSVYQS